MSIDAPIHFFDLGEVVLVPVGAKPAQGYVRLSAAEGRFFIQAWLRHAEPRALQQLARMLGMEREWPENRAVCVERFLARLEGDLPRWEFHRRIRVTITLRPRPVEEQVVSLAELTTEPLEETESTNLSWIEIHLRDADDRPIPYVRYEIRLPNRELRWGILDGQGQARLEDIPEGHCHVSFPQS